MAFFQFNLRLQLFQRQLRRPAVFAGFLGFRLDVCHITLDRGAGSIFAGTAAGRDLCFQDALLGQLLHTADRFPQQLGDHRGAGPLRHRAGQHRRLFALCPLSGAAGLLLFRHRRHLLFAPAGCPAGFAFPVLGDFVFFAAPFSAYTPVGGYNFPGISKNRNVTAGFFSVFTG